MLMIKLYQKTFQNKFIYDLSSENVLYFPYMQNCVKLTWAKGFMSRIKTEEA